MISSGKTSSLSNLSITSSNDNEFAKIKFQDLDYETTIALLIHLGCPQDFESRILNLNYTKNSFEKGSFYNTDQYLFFQNGKELIFNKPIPNQFTVKYSYIPSSLRFRLILRNNIPGIYNGLSVNNVVLKCKVKNLDPFSEKLLRLS